MPALSTNLKKLLYRTKLIVLPVRPEELRRDLDHVDERLQAALFFPLLLFPMLTAPGAVLH